MFYMIIETELLLIEKYLSDRVENIEGNGENAGYHYLLFPVFQGVSFLRSFGDYMIKVFRVIIVMKLDCEERNLIARWK